MYVTTFYSFKGGVGRTFALVNIAAELAKSGKRVLLVDFDLEAPGIHTFDALRPASPHAGVVEYVSEYMATNVSPDVRDFVYEVVGTRERIGDGQLWVMPSGCGDQEYRVRLSSINWKELYRDREGYLFFEDLKAQWDDAFAPDYVLIDSRTGHTDVEGICTRQLPDAVVLLFFPNEQNLRGIQEVVQDIESETERSRKGRERISLHFVMSNVPDLDDEDGILGGRIQEFRRALKRDSFGIIHNYPSLSLLNQAIFTLERPKSRLAKEYRRLKEQIVDDNDGDVEGVIRFLKQYESPRFQLGRKKIVDVNRRLKSIEDKHGGNGEVLFLLGMIRKGEGNLSEAISHFSNALERGYRASACLVGRATCYAMLPDRQQMSLDLERLFELTDVRDHERFQAIQLLRRMADKATLRKVARSSLLELADPDTKLLMARELVDVDGPMESIDVVEQLLDDARISKSLRDETGNKIALVLMGKSEVVRAMRIMSPQRPNPRDLAIEDAFNYAMAEWAETGQPHHDMFARVVEIVEAGDDRDASPNFDQCVAMSLWAVGRFQDASERLEIAKRKAQNIKTTEFSCWRYREVPQDMFLEDCEAIARLFKTNQGRPLFFPVK